MISRPFDAWTEGLSDIPGEGERCWAFLSHTAVDTPFLRREVVIDRPEHFFLMDYRTHPPVATETYRRQILTVLGSCAWFVVAVSEAALRQEWVAV
jgi:hypothetical protein